MHSLNDTALESNKYLKINFDGGGLSSDAGLLLVKEFSCRLGFDKILKSEFKTNDSAMSRIHKDDENLWQMDIIRSSIWGIHVSGRKLGLSEACGL